MMNRTIVSALAFMLALAGCESQDTLMDTMETPRSAHSSKALEAPGGPAAFAPSYVLISKGNKLPRNLKAQVRAAGGELTGSADAIGVAFATSKDPGFAGKLKGIEVVRDMLFTLEPTREEAFSEGSPNRPAANAGSDEPLFPYLWGMQAIHAPQAWDAGVRGAGVLVAVLDEGFGLNHPDVPYRQDLAKSFACWKVIDGEAYVSEDPADCEPPQYLLNDVFSHGSHVSGTIAARDNGLGVIGVAPDAEIMPVKVLSEILGGGTAGWVIQGILYAADNGADVINMSLGGVRSLGGGKGTNQVARLLNAYKRAVNYAIKQGVTVIAAAGNDGLNGDGNGPVRFIPADFEGAIAVSATAPEGLIDNPQADLNRPASYTNYGASLVDFAAPGGDFDYQGNFILDLILSTGATGYYFSAGTSMAAPHASGVAALIISENGGSMKPSQVEAALRRRALDLGKPGNDDFYGHGLVNTGY